MNSSRHSFRVGPPKGTLVVDVFGASVVLTGGPYANKPPKMVGVKMAKEIDLPATYSIPTADFSVPSRSAVIETALDILVDAIEGSDIYVGCMAGQGRTGLFLASVLALVGDPFPVQSVRSEYYPHAVETSGQEHFVAQMVSEAPYFRRKLMRRLIDRRAINFTWFGRMTLSEKWLYLRLRLLGS